MKQNNTKSRLSSTHLLLIFLASLIGMQVYFSNKIATSGDRLRFLEQRAVELEDENQRLLAQNVDTISLHELAQKAENMGFVEPEEIINFAHNDMALQQQ